MMLTFVVSAWISPGFTRSDSCNRFSTSITRTPSSCTLSSCISVQSTSLQNDLLLRVAQGDTNITRTPIWLFRQAGRHLPEYNAYKTRVNKNFLQLLQSPEDVTEITLQPIKRYNLDAAILFSDILVIPQAMNLDVTMPGGVGITIPDPIQSPFDLYNRIHLNIDVKSKLKYVMQSINQIQSELNNSIPLIGFSAAPWTLLFYMVGGSSRVNMESNVGIHWLIQYPNESKQLLKSLSEIVEEYIVQQIDHGVNLVQLFEAMGSYISEELYTEVCLPYLCEIVRNVKRRRPEYPVMVFVRGGSYTMETLSEVGVDVVTLDGSVELEEVRNRLGSCVVQGCFDPKTLITSGAGIEHDKTHVKIEVEAMLKRLGTKNLIVNLSEGLSGKEDPELVHCLVDSVHSISQQMMMKEDATQQS